MRLTSLLCCLFLAYSSAHAFQPEDLDRFLEDLIDTWQLRSPTIAFQDDLSELCFRHQWLLCLSDGLDTTELANHFNNHFSNLTHKHRRQDGIIFVGEPGHEELLKEIEKTSPSLLTTNYPIFMPISYKDDIKLRLDSHVYFYGNKTDSKFELKDIFAVKGGQPITISVGQWDKAHGVTMHKTVNRWERRTDLKGATFLNVLALNPGWAEFIRDENNNTIVGSKGLFQDLLFYATDNLNLTIQTVEVPMVATLFPNGSWNGGLGLLQQKKADVFSPGAGITAQRAEYIDYSIGIHRQPITLHAAIQKGITLNMWVFVRVFGHYQWLVFITMLLLIALGIHLTNILHYEESGDEFGTKRSAQKNYKLNSISSSFALVSLYAIQMGSHTNSKSITKRLTTFTASLFTLLMFVYYTMDITAEMTAGPPKIEIRNFRDVIDNGYGLVSDSPYFRDLLESGPPDMKEVYNFHLEKTENLEESLKSVIADPKTLLYCAKYITDVKLANLVAQTHAMDLDDAFYANGGLAFQKDSEFVQLFNHYMLRGYESGFIARNFKDHHSHFFTNENYEMIEPQPLRFNNVMFCFIFLSLGICFSISIVLFEYAVKKKSPKHQNLATTIRVGAVAPAPARSNRE